MRRIISRENFRISPTNIRGIRRVWLLAELQTAELQTAEFAELINFTFFYSI